MLIISPDDCAVHSFVSLYGVFWSVRLAETKKYQGNWRKDWEILMLRVWVVRQ